MLVEHFSRVGLWAGVAMAFFALGLQATSILRGRRTLRHRIKEIRFARKRDQL